MSIDDETWTLRRLLSDVVGSGPRSAVDMTYEQARCAMWRILVSDPDPTTLGAFWVANRWKSNTPEELAGFVDEMRDHLDTGPNSRATGDDATPIVDCGASYNGKKKTAILGVAAGLVAAEAGVSTAVHAADRVPTKFGDTYTQVLQALEIPTDLERADSRRMLEETGFGFYYRPKFHHRMDALLDRRSKVGLRTFLNTIETLANPAEARVHLGSCYHLTFAKRIIDTAQQARYLDFDRIVIFQGLEGYDDIRPGRCKIVEYRGDKIEDFDVEPEGLGLDFDREKLEVDDVARDSARLTAEILDGGGPQHFRSAVVLNAAVRIYAGAPTVELVDAVDKAGEVLDGSGPRGRLQTLREFR